MRLAAALVACGGLLLALTTGAGAVTLRGTSGPDRLNGTDGPDALYGLGGADHLHARRGPDLLLGGPGRDVLTGAAGADRLAVSGDGAVDTVSCGPGVDVVNADLADRVGAACELVSRQLSRDTLFSADGQHETQVEPDSFAFGSTIVAAFQIGRFVDGGAAAIGFATSRDGGRTWRSGQLPGVTSATAVAGNEDAASDPSVAYDARHGTWLVATLGISARNESLLINRSRDGLSWSAPVSAAAPGERGFDKEWIACDNGANSPFRGRCYLSYLDAPGNRILTRTSGDGGLTWTGPVATSAPPGRFVNGAQPVVRPDGSLIVVYSDFAAFSGGRTNELRAARSTDGGASFEPPVVISELLGFDVRGMRAPQFSSAEVDRGGRVYVAWQDCRFTEDCIATDIVLSSSANGTHWSQPIRVPTTGGGDWVDEFTPGLAVDPTTSAGSARLAIVYHSLVECGRLMCVDVSLISSRNGGAAWTVPRRLNAEPMPSHWLADTGLGRMTGDYISASYSRGRAVPVFALATAPAGETFHQAIFAKTPR